MTVWTCALLATLAAEATPVPAPKEKPKLLLTALTVGKDVDPAVGLGLTDAIAAEVARQGFFQVMSTSDVANLLGAERQRQLMGGCSEAAESCLAELSGAIGARFVMNGTLSRLGDSWQLTLQTLDTQKAAPLGRATRIVKDPVALKEQLPWVVADATAAPLPPPKSKVPSILLLSGGGLALVAGGLLGYQAVQREGDIKRELAAGAVNPSVLRSRASYLEDETDLARNKTLALVLLAVGAGGIAAGYFLWPSTPAGAPVQASLVPSGNGVALVGAF